MRKLALSDEILLKVDKAARYIGGEVNSVMKDKNAVDIRFAMCFPDVYEIGMSNLGMMILYNMFNQREDVWCERLFSPWPDLDKVMREKKIPLPTIAGQDKANPGSVILCGALMLEQMGMPAAAERIRNAMSKAIAGRAVTVDLAAQVEGARVVGCQEFGEIIGACL